MTHSSFRIAVCALTSLAAAPALAQAPAETFEFKGDVPAMSAWSIDGKDQLWMMSEDGNTLVIGHVYDLGSEVPMMDFMPADASAFPPDLRPAVDIKETPPPIALNEDPANGLNLPEETARSIEKTLSGVSPEQKSAFVIDLVRRIEGANSPTELQLLIIEWQAELEGQDEVASNARIALDTMAGQAGAAAGVAESAKIEKAAAQVEADDDGRMLLNQLQSLGDWLVVGDVNAPPVYAFIDPTCPHCARAMSNIAGDISSGRIQLRVLLVPALSERSASVIAAILADGDPAANLLEHEKSYDIRGTSDFMNGDFYALPQKAQDGIKANYQLMLKYRIPGVPFFGYMSEDGAKFKSGEVGPDYFTRNTPVKF